MDAAHGLIADMPAGQFRLDPRDLDLAQHPEYAMSLYDKHSDDSGCCYSSRLRPIVNMRPKYRHVLARGPRHFSADLYLVDWLEQKNFSYDVATDEDLHHERQDLLANYRVILTGTHPEYWTAPMLEAWRNSLQKEDGSSIWVETASFG